MKRKINLLKLKIKFRYQIVRNWVYSHEPKWFKRCIHNNVLRLWFLIKLIRPKNRHAYFQLKNFVQKRNEYIKKFEIIQETEKIKRLHGKGLSPSQQIIQDMQRKKILKMLQGDKTPPPLRLG